VPRILVVIPTYNEAENILRLLPEVLRQAEGIESLSSTTAPPTGPVRSPWVQRRRIRSFT